MNKEERLLNKVVVLSNGCWMYSGGLNQRGYGNFWDNGTRSAHVVSYELFVGQIPEGHSVLHKCDFKPCINPEHLFTGTAADNITDMVTKGRARFSGVLNGRALLTEVQVVEIKRLLSLGCSRHEIAHCYGVSYSTICAIKQGRLWKNVA